MLGMYASHTTLDPGTQKELVEPSDLFEQDFRQWGCHIEMSAVTGTQMYRATFQCSEDLDKCSPETGDNIFKTLFMKTNCVYDLIHTR